MTDEAAATPRMNHSLRPEITARLMAETGLDEALLRRLIAVFYGKVRQDALLGPIFAGRIADWGPHLERMGEFWSSVALMTGRYHGAPMQAHLDLPVDWSHFERWLELFRETATEVCTPDGAEHVITRAERIARSLHMGISEYQAGQDRPPVFGQGRGTESGR